MTDFLRNNLSFGFEQTFTIEEWWTEPGFVATSDTPLKREKMKALADAIAQVLNGKSVESVDIYNHLQYETFDAEGKPSFVVTMDPGSIEVKTPPLMIDEIVPAMRPLFEAAEIAKVVAYRPWWYGVKKGTEGGCHINLAGLAPETNPLAQHPDLVLKYVTFFHNHPCLHYPFMGVDVGPGGNSMRMDEHALDPYPEADKGREADSMDRLEELAARPHFTKEEMEAQFRGTKISEDKHSAPSLYKFKAPLYFIEERAVEALRSAEEFGLLSEIRLKILAYLHARPMPKLERFDMAKLHSEGLCSAVLWRQFIDLAAEIGFDPAPYRLFFDRQFPVLSGLMEDATDVALPRHFKWREGRRPRIFKGVQMRGELVISKTIDIRYNRFEFEKASVKPIHFTVEGKPLEAMRIELPDGPVWSAQLDTFFDKDDPASISKTGIISVSAFEDGVYLETVKFNLPEMRFTGV